MPDVAEQPAKPLRTWRPMVLWTAALLLALAGCRAATDKGQAAGSAMPVHCEESRPTLGTKPADAERSAGLPPVVMYPFGGWARPEPGKTYELRLAPQGPADPPPPAKAWVHRVTRRIPDLGDRKTWGSWAAKVGVGSKPREVDHAWYFHEKDAAGRVYGLTILERRRTLEYDDNREPPPEEVYAASKRNSLDKMREMGEEKAKAMGWWPKGVKPKALGIGAWSTSVSNVPGPFTSEIRAGYGALIEGRLVAGEGFMFKISTLTTGMLRGMELRWAESERWKELPCKPVEEAFQALNRGYGPGVPKAGFGEIIYYVGWTYYFDHLDDEYIHPVFMFRLGQKDGFPLYVPAVKSECFADPKRQVLSDREWVQAKQKAGAKP